MDAAVAADADGGAALGLVRHHFGGRLVIIGAHHHDVLQMGVFAEHGPDANDTVLERRIGDEAAVTDDHVIDVAAVDLGGRQVTRVRVDRGAAIKEVEGWQGLGECEVGIEERLHRPDVLPVTLEDVAAEFFAAEERRNDLLAEILHVVVQRSSQDLAAEDVDAHGGQALFLRALGRQFGLQFRTDGQSLDDGGLLGLLDKLGDREVVGDAHQTQALDFRNGERDRRDGHVCAGRDMLVHDLAEIHPIQLVTGEDQDKIMPMAVEVHEVAAHGVGRALIPGVALLGLLGREDVDKAAAERVELVALLDVPVQRGGEELGEDKDPVATRVQTVADRDVHQPVFAGEGHRRLAAFLGQGEEPRAAPAAHDHRQDSFGFGHRMEILIPCV